MKVILQREVDKLGAPGDVVAVADGYARNYLMPKGLAVAATKGAVRHAERLRQAHEKHVRRAVEEATELATRLSTATLRMGAKVGEEGRIFGSITVADITEEIQRSTGVAVDRRAVHLPEPIRSVGTHEVAIHLHPEVNAVVTVEVVPQ
jgi:large subunit ribosomal protein L9